MDFRDRVSNWSRAHRWYTANGRAFSVEGKFRSPQTWDALPICPGPRIDPLDAWCVEIAWRQLPERSRWVLKFQHHQLDVHPEQACRLIAKYAGLRLRVHDWRKYLRVARHELALLLGEAPEPPRVVSPTAAQINAGPAQRGAMLPTHVAGLQGARRADLRTGGALGSNRAPRILHQTPAGSAIPRRYSSQA